MTQGSKYSLQASMMLGFGFQSTGSEYSGLKLDLQGSTWTSRAQSGLPVLNFRGLKSGPPGPKSRQSGPPGLNLALQDPVWSNLPRASIIDVTMAVSGNSQHDAARTLRRLSDQYPEVGPNWSHLKFKGRGQRGWAEERELGGSRM